MQMFRITGDNRTAKEKSCLEIVWWTLLYLICTSVCAFFLIDVIKRWDPVVVSFPEVAPIWQIPFPAVTLCPITKARKDVFNITNMFHLTHFHNSSIAKLSEEELARLTAISQVCDSFIFDDIERENLTNCEECITSLKVVGIPKDDNFFYSDFRGNESLVDFQVTVTEEGICYTFNALHESDIVRASIANGTKSHYNWTMETGYGHKDLFTYPHRALGTGFEFGLWVMLQLEEQHLDYVCQGAAQGYKVVLHAPDEIPQPSKVFFQLPLKHEVKLAVEPQMMTISDSLKDFKPHRRQCYLNSERYLQFFKVYNQANCELECLTNFTLKECGCVKFNMPRTPGTRLCGIHKIRCMINAEQKLIENEINNELQNSFAEPRHTSDCSCLPACTSVIYSAVPLQTSFDWISRSVAFDDLSDLDSMKSGLLVTFKRPKFMVSKQSVVFGRTDFFASCGGLLGLFMGISVIGCFKQFHFCTVRIIRSVLWLFQKLWHVLRLVFCKNPIH